MARGAYFSNVDPRLLKAIEANAKFGKYSTRMTSGYRPKNSARPSSLRSQHGQGGDGYEGSAIDLELIGEDGAALDNYKDPENAAAYQQYANQLYKWALDNDPSLAKELRWGGYFGGPRGKYGSLDLMHFDTGGDQIGMAGGSWEGGFNDQQAKTWGLQAGGGIGELDAKMEAAGYTPEQRRNAIASIESAGSGDYGALGAWTGDRIDGRDRAYGRYQVMGNNIAPWAEQYLDQSGVTREAFLADPKLQDDLFDAVYGDYVRAFGERGAASKWFTGSEKEPNVTDVNGKLTGGTYADKYIKALEGSTAASSGGGGVHPPNATVGTGGYVQPGADTTPVPKDKATKKKKGWGDYLAKFGEDMADMPGMKTPEYNLPAQPKAALASAMPTIIAGSAEESRARRENLALIMARLNKGTLV